MERKNSRSVFLKNTRLFWEHVFPDACLGFRFGILPPAGQRSQKKNTFSGFRFGILPPAGQRSQKKHVPGKKHAYIAYIAYIYIIYIYIFYTYSMQRLA